MLVEIVGLINHRLFPHAPVKLFEGFKRSYIAKVAKALLGEGFCGEGKSSLLLRPRGDLDYGVCHY